MMPDRYVSHWLALVPPVAQERGSDWGWGMIGLSDLPLTLHDPPPEPATGRGLVAAVEALERSMNALGRADGVQTRAADLLGISERVLRYKLKKYGLAGAE